MRPSQLAMALRLARLSPLFLCLAAVLLASAAEAQIVRPSKSIYVILRGGATLYHGDIDEDSDDNLGAAELQLIDQLEDAGPSLGAEVGYLIDESLSFGLGYVFQTNENFDVSIGPFDNDAFGGYFVRNDDRTAHQFRALFRYLPFPQARVTPVVEMGAALVFGNGTESERRGFDEFDGPDDDQVIGYGPLLGIGVDWALSPRWSIVGGLQSTLVFPDVALDGAEPGVYGSVADDADYDILANLGLGVKYAFFNPIVPPDVVPLCPSELVVGEFGSFQVTINDDATPPVTVTWEFGDGVTATGLTASHAFTAPGTYTVTATAQNRGGTDTESCLVTVLGIAPTLLNCSAATAEVGPGEQVTVNATVAGTEPIRITVDFGDGTTASTLPARHAYAAAGDYTVTITATNAYGTATCPVPIVVEDRFCDQITELNAVFFGYGSSTLTADARARLDENIEILRRCPDICVTINGYSDGAEPNPLATAQARAEAVRAYYIANGIAPERLRATGRGVAPDANPKEDPGPGDSRARIATSIPSNCAGF